MIDGMYGSLTIDRQSLKRIILIPLSLAFLFVLVVWFIYPGGYGGYNAGFAQGYQDGLDIAVRIDEMNVTLIVVGNTTSLANAEEDQVWKFNVTFESNCSAKTGVFSGGEKIIYRHCWNSQKVVPVVLVDCPITETYRGINIRPEFLRINQTRGL